MKSTAYFSFRKMLHLIFVEAALEAVPPGIISHPSVRRNAKRRKKPPGETLLNRSLHHSVMDRIPDGHKRGRPDITNICLLEALGSPLNREGRLSTWLHTFGGYSIEVSPEAREIAVSARLEPYSPSALRSSSAAPSLTLSSPRFLKSLLIGARVNSSAKGITQTYEEHCLF